MSPKKMNKEKNKKTDNRRYLDKYKYPSGPEINSTSKEMRKLP